MVIILHSGEENVLILKDGDSGRVFAEFPLSDGTFEVTFIHSVNNTPYTDIYEVRDGEIWVVGVKYYGYGAGVPDSLEEGQTLTYDIDGSMVISGMDTRIARLVYVVGTVHDHILTIDGEEHSLTELCGRNTAVEFSIKRN